ncbi:MAG: hypothetical protein HYY13_13690 [Nitrospirae bacterium]|nr:hypothetical protein [Nitrospirota bacterium]
MTHRFTILGSRFSILALLLTLYTFPFTILPTCGGGDEGGGNEGDPIENHLHALQVRYHKTCDVLFACGYGRKAAIFDSATSIRVSPATVGECRALMDQRVSGSLEIPDRARCAEFLRATGLSSSYVSCMEDVASLPNESLCQFVDVSEAPYYDGDDFGILGQASSSGCKDYFFRQDNRVSLEEFQRLSAGDPCGDVMQGYTDLLFAPERGSKRPLVKG